MIFLDIETLDFFQDEHIKRLPRPAQLLAMRFGLATTYDDTHGWRQWWPDALLGAQTHRDACWSNPECWSSSEIQIWLWTALLHRTIVGWNIFDFDIPLLMLHISRMNYGGDPWLDPMQIIDLMDACTRASRAWGRERWYKLHDVSLATLGRGKTGDGQQAAEWLRTGDGPSMLAAATYCRNDVQLTMDLFAAAQTTGLLLPARPERDELGALRLWLDAEGQIVECRKEQPDAA